MAGFAWVTLATNDSYSLGALVLANSLREVGTSHQLAVLVTPGVTNAMREQLRSIFNVVVEVNILDSKDEANLRLLQRPELGVTFTKLHCWRLTQFEKCVFLDADTLVLQNADELFEREELSAAPDVGWPDCFNSGVFVYRPSNETYENLVKFALERGSFDGGDQGLLNLYFSDWAHKDISKHLPFLYNVCSTAVYSYLPAFKQFGADVKIVHFIGPAKPWLQYFDTESRKVQPSSDLRHLQTVLQRWWDLFFSYIQPKLSSEMARSKSPAVHYYPQPSNPYTSFPPSQSIDYAITANECGPESDYQNVWDPWDDYGQKTDPSTTELLEHSSQLITESITNIASGLHESHNTNAHCVLPPPPPPPLPCYQPTFHHPPNEQNTNNCNAAIEIQYTPALRPQSPVYVVENQNSHTNNNPTQIHFPPRIPTPTEHFPPRIPTPPIENIQTTQQFYARLHEFEQPCTVTNESTLHPNDSGSHDNNDGDAGLAAAFSQLKLGEPRSPGQLALEDNLRRQGWEIGNIDYLGKDSFDNIWKKICQTIDSAPKPKEPTPPPPAVETASVPTTVAPAAVTEVQAATTTPAEAPVAPAPAAEAPVTATPAEVPPQVAVDVLPAELSPVAEPTAVPQPVESIAEAVAPAATPVESAPAVASSEPPTAAVSSEPATAAVPAATPSQPALVSASSEAQPDVAPSQVSATPPADVPVEVPAVAPVKVESAAPAAVPASVTAPETQPAEVSVPVAAPAAPADIPVSAPAVAPVSPLAVEAASPAPAQAPAPAAPIETASPAPTQAPAPAAPVETASTAPTQVSAPVTPVEAASVAPTQAPVTAAPVEVASPAPAQAPAPAAPVEVPAAAAVAAPKAKEDAKKQEPKSPAASTPAPSTEATSPTPPPRKAGSSPKKPKAKK